MIADVSMLESGVAKRERGAVVFLVGSGFIGLRQGGSYREFYWKSVVGCRVG